MNVMNGMNKVNKVSKISRLKEMVKFDETGEPDEIDQLPVENQMVLTVEEIVFMSIVGFVLWKTYSLLVLQ